MNTRNLLILMAALLAPLAVADDVRTLGWEDLIPATDFSMEPPGANSGRNHGSGSGGRIIPDPTQNPHGANVPGMGFMPAGTVKELDRAMVKLPGFVVPLEVVDDGKVAEFLLVPYFGACIHYPPPPANQIVYVTMKKPVVMETLWDPIWVTGQMRTDTISTDLATAGYTISATEIEIYDY